MAITKLTSDEYDALTEIGNLGGGNAARALSQMIGKSVSVKIPNVKISKVSKIADDLGGAENNVTAIHMKVSGEVLGNVLLIFSRENALNLIDMISAKPLQTTKLIGSEEASVLKEISNILSGSYLTAISDFLSIKSVQSIPRLYRNNKLMLVLQKSMPPIGLDDYALLIKTNFSIESYETKGFFIALFDQTSLKSILNKIDKKLS